VARFSSKIEAGQLLAEPVVRALLLKDDGSIPNNPRLPLLVYQGALNLPSREPASAIECLLASNHWGGCWRNGIYSYHHYHSTAHEALLVYRGSATVQLGGERGITETIKRGDVLIIPAGVGHKNLGQAGSFEIVGAYPAGQDWDICYGKPGERPRADKNIARVPLPKSDPVYGPNGPLIKEWSGSHQK
jgi:uncharacterized protein YjlB